MKRKESAVSVADFAMHSSSRYRIASYALINEQIPLNFRALHELVSHAEGSLHNEHVFIVRPFIQTGMQIYNYFALNKNHCVLPSGRK